MANILELFTKSKLKKAYFISLMEKAYFSFINKTEINRSLRQILLKMIDLLWLDQFLVVKLNCMIK